MRIKRLLCVAVIVLSLCVATPALASEPKALSNMTDEECIEFANAHGVTIPEWYENDLDWAPFIRSVISMVEENPDVLFGFGHTDLLDFAEAIQLVLIENNYINSNATRALESSTTNILKDNWVYGLWEERYKDYNCYAYAIGQTDQLNPGELSGNSYSGIPEVSELAHYAKEDLWALGYTDAFASSRPYTSSGHMQVLRFRRGSFYDEDNWCMTTDYHVMKNGSDGYWYHKPGRTNPLKYKYIDSSADWVYEAYDGKYYKRNESVKYTDEIWYVIYTTPCKYTWKYCGNNQHILTCTTCGKTTGQATNCTYVNDICTSCAHGKVHQEIMGAGAGGTAAISR